MARNLIDGQKAGGGSPRQPVIAPDSASSITKLKIVVGLSEGEIEGFGRDDIKLDGTPLSALSNDIICDYRFGTNSQAYIAGVDEVANEIGVGIELSGSTDWVKLITNSDIDHVGIRLRWGPLQTSHTNGDLSGVSIKYDIHIAVVGGSSECVLSTTLSDKTSDSYERYHEFKLPESDNGWIVRVVRVTPSASSSLISDKMYVQAYSEIIKSKFTFPYTSLVYLEYDAKTFSNIAKLAVNAKGLIIRVPSNYSPVTREYSGLWNGTFKMAYSNNPAWVYHDLVTNPRYGCGDRIDQSMVDKWSLYRLAQYCDQMVDDGYGGLEPRFTCNIYLQSKERAYDTLNRLTGLFRAINFWNGAQIVVDADIPQDTSYLYTNANVVDGLFEYAGTAATDLYSAAKVAWDNPANGYNTEYEAVSYEHLVKKLGFKVLELDAWGCTSRGQALRAGRWALLAESDTVTFKVGMDGYLAMPGKVIEIQDEFYAGKSNGGRVISVSASRLEVTLDRPVETIAGDTISFNTTASTVKKYNIASSAGSVVTLSEEVDLSVERMHIWAISSSQLATQKYRILTVKYDGVGEFTISAVEYNASKYEEIDSNILFDEPPTSIINPIAQVAVKNVTISSNEYVYQGLNTVNLEIKWERAENAVEYLVELKKDDGSWLKLPSTGNNSIVLENVYAGYYIASVTAISAFELKSLPAYSIKTVVLGKQSMPLPPLNPRIVPIQFGIEFYWDFPQGATDTAISRIVVAYLDPTGAVDDSGFLSYDKAYSDNKIVIQNLDLHTRVWFKVKLIDKLGFESPYTSWISGIPSQDFDKVMDLISGQIEQSDLYDDLSQKIDVGYGASAAATNAQATADQAQATVAQVQAQVTTTTTELRGLLNTTADGLTQEILDRQNGDADVVGQLTTYKTSNDAAMSAVQQQAEAATSASSANATALTNLNTEVAATHNLASNALQQAQSATDATSTNASNLIALSSRMDSAVQAGDNLLINSNVDKPYNGNYPHGIYALGESWEVGETYTLLWCASFVRTAPDQSILALAAYAGGWWQSLQTVDAEGERQVHKVTFVVRPEGAYDNEIYFFLLNSNGGYLDAVATMHWAVLVKASDISTKAWVRSKYDIDNAINANAQAIRNTETNVATIDDKVTAQATDIFNLNSSLTNLNNTKLDADIIQQYRTAVDQDSVTAGELTQFKSALKIGGDNLFTGTKTFNNQSSENSTSNFYPSNGGFGGNTQEFLFNALFGTHTVVKTSSSWCGFYLREADGVSWEAQEDMVLSFWANASADVHVYGVTSQLGHLATIAANQPMTKYEVLIPKGKPLRNASNQGIIEFDFQNGGELWYGAVMLQVGTKSTAWQPSSKDNDLDTSQFASATALENLTTNVSNIGGQVSSLSQQTNTLSTTVGNNTAAIQLQQSSIDGINAKATLQVEAGGTIGGVALGNNGGVVDFIVRANTFAVAPPEGVPNDTKYMMTYQANDQTLPNGTVIPKGLKVNDAIIGTINANKIYAESLSAVSANLGTFTSSVADKGTTVISGPLIDIKYPNGVSAVKIGIW